MLNRNSETTCPLHFGDDIGCIFQEGVDQLDFRKPLSLIRLGCHKHLLPPNPMHKNAEAYRSTLGDMLVKKRLSGPLPRRYATPHGPCAMPGQQSISGSAHGSQTTAELRLRPRAETKLPGLPLTSGARSILNPFSFPELSFQLRFIWPERSLEPAGPAVAARVLGALMVCIAVVVVV